MINIRAIRAKIKIAEVASFEKPRVFGESNLNAVRDGVRILKVILRERFAGRSIPVFDEAIVQPANTSMPGVTAAKSPFTVPVPMFQLSIGNGFED